MSNLFGVSVQRIITIKIHTGKRTRNADTVVWSSAQKNGTINTNNPSAFTSSRFPLASTNPPLFLLSQLPSLSALATLSSPLSRPQPSLSPIYSQGQFLHIRLPLCLCLRLHLLSLPQNSSPSLVGFFLTLPLVCESSLFPSQGQHVKNTKCIVFLFYSCTALVQSSYKENPLVSVSTQQKTS